MKGSYRVVVFNAKLRYDFEIHRNITIIKGDSATGKTTLVEMIREYYEEGADSGISLSCDRPCRTLGGRDWKILLKSIRESIVFIDEDNSFLPSDEFARSVRESDNYYVIVTREGLPNLPYSVNEIYGIHESGKYAFLRQTYNEFFHLYGQTDYAREIEPKHIITEDSNAGFEFFHGIQGDRFTVESANGKSNIAAGLMAVPPETLIIADGAAFGCEMDRVMKLIRRNNHAVLYLPESFEWLILKAGLIDESQTEAILEHPEDYIESRDYFSWERFFTALLSELTRDHYLQYSKRKLNPVYLQKEIADRIVSGMENIRI